MFHEKYVQVNKMSTMFRFMKLPGELRLMLWRFTWRDRVVILQIGKLVHHSYSSAKEVFYAEIEIGRLELWIGDSRVHFDADIVHTHARLPTTFFVNSESREETLKH